MPAQKTPLSLYKQKVDAELIHHDPAQEKAMIALDHLFHELMDEHTRKKGLMEWVSTLGRNYQDVTKGLYLYGGVGRGKSMMMDLFFDCLPTSIKKRRVHFHAFMIEVHDYFHARRSDAELSIGVEGLITPLATLIAARSKVLCFDEFHVVDVADAMILGRLFTALLDQGVVVVSTSNWEPDRLYENGLQRDRFVPFIELLKRRTHIMEIDSVHDYRRLVIAQEGTYFHPLGKDSDDHADTLFAKLTQGEPTHRKIISVKGRKIVSNHCAEGVARFTFAQLCEQPLGAEDYIAIADTFHTLFLEHVPKLTYDRRNEAKRLMTLIDALYEAETNLIVTADAGIEELYIGHDHAEEFQRTVSRLIEMQNR